MKKFIHGRTYRVEEFIDTTWGADHQHTRALPPSTRFVYCKPPGAFHGYFEEVVEPDNPLIPSDRAQRAVEELRDRGMSYRQIARLGGVSVEAVHRSASGVGRIRASTQEAILTLASSANGNS